MPRRRAFLSSSVLLVAMSCAANTAANTEWLNERFDWGQTGFAPESGDISSPSVVWRLPIGQLATSRTVLVVDQGGGGPELITISSGAVVARDRQNRALWSSPNHSFSELIGVWDFNGDGNVELLALRRGIDPFMALVDMSSGNLVWTFDTIPFAQSMAGSRMVVADVTRDGLPDIVTTIQTSTLVRCFSFGEGFEGPQPFWSTELEGYTYSLYPIVANFHAAEGLEVLVFQYGNYSLLAGSDGTVLLSGQEVMTGYNFGFASAADVDGDGLDELAAVSFRHPLARRVGVLNAESATWRWLYEYFPDQRDVQVESVAEGLADIDGDGELELLVSYFDNTDTETTGFPGGELGDHDGIDAPDVWVTAIFDARTGSLERTFDDVLLRGAVDVTRDGQPDLVFSDAVSVGGVLSFVSESLVYDLSGVEVETVVRLPASALLRGGSARRPGTFSERADSPILTLDGDPIFAVEIGPDGQPNRFARVTGVGEEPEVATLDVTPDNPVSLLRGADPGHVLGIGPESGLAVYDAAFDVVAAGISADGFQTTPRVAVFQDGTSDLAITRHGHAMRAFRLSSVLTTAPELRWQVLGRLQTSTDGVATTSGAFRWVHVVLDAEQQVVVRALDQQGNESWEYESEVFGGSVRGLASAGRLTRQLYLPVQDASADPEDEFRAHLINATNGAFQGRTVPLTNRFRRRGLALPATENWSAGYLAVTENQLIRFNEAGSTLQTIDNSGVNDRVMVVDLSGDGEPDIVTSFVFLPGSQYGYCAYDGLTGDPLWCSPERFRREGSARPFTAIPDGTGAFDVVLHSIVGELRRHDGLTGAPIWSVCLDRGEATAMNPDPMLPLEDPCPSAALSPPIAVDIDGDDEVELLVGSADGFMYALASAGDLEQAVALRAPVGQPVLADLESDGTPEIIVSLGTGEVVALDQASLDAPSNVRDVSVDPLTGELGDDDIDTTADFSRVAARWEPVDDAESYRAELTDSNGVQVSFVDDLSASTGSHVFEDLVLTIGETYTVIVWALGALGEISEEARSDGVTVVDSGRLDIVDESYPDYGADVGVDVGTDVFDVIDDLFDVAFDEADSSALLDWPSPNSDSDTNIDEDDLLTSHPRSDCGCGQASGPNGPSWLLITVFGLVAALRRFGKA